eukprot:scaffold2045_cov404-Prasinococcus_capsulatus_cf.AAC.77
MTSVVLEDPVDLVACASGKLPRQHADKDRRWFKMRKDVLLPTSSSKPRVGMMLKRTTTSC